MWIHNNVTARVMVEHQQSQKSENIEVFIGNAGSDDSRIALIAESARLRSGYANSHVISSIET